MWNIFEHWWTALAVALGVQIVLAIIHIIRPESRKFWHILIPLAVIVVGIGVERLVQTDFEKINILIDKCLTATADENIAAIGALLAPDYSDSCHKSKESAMQSCRRWFGQPLISVNKKYSVEITIDRPAAQVNLIVVTHLDPKSEYYQSVKLLLIKARLYLHRNADGRWLINRAELLEVNNQPVKWNEI
jgi:hypothetical protein